MGLSWWLIFVFTISIIVVDAVAASCASEASCARAKPAGRAALERVVGVGVGVLLVPTVIGQAAPIGRDAAGRPKAVGRGGRLTVARLSLREPSLPAPPPVEAGEELSELGPECVWGIRAEVRERKG